MTLKLYMRWKWHPGNVAVPIYMSRSTFLCYGRIYSTSNFDLYLLSIFAIILVVAIRAVCLQRIV